MPCSLTSMVHVLISRVPWPQRKLLLQQNCRLSFPLKPPAWQLANLSSVINFLSGIQTCHLSHRLSLWPVVWGFQILKDHLGDLEQSFSTRDRHIWGLCEVSRCAPAHSRFSESPPREGQGGGGMEFVFFLSFPGNSDKYLCLTATKVQRDRLYLQAHHCRFLFWTRLRKK